MRNYLALLMVLVVFAGCKNKQPAMAPPVIPVFTAKTEQIKLTKDFVGQTYGLFDISIRARVDGYLEGIHFKEGGRVKKGQLLYSIDPAPLDAKVAEALSMVAQAKTNLVKAESDYNRYKPLAETNAVSQSDYDAAVANFGAAQASLEAAEASLQYAKIQQSYSKIYSPINGIIGRSMAKAGDYVGREPNPVVLNTVSRLDTILVQFHLTEQQYLNLAQYAKAQETLKTPPKERQADILLFFADGSQHPELGKFDFIGRNIDPTTGTVMVQASFPNTDELVRPGQFARLRLVLTEPVETLLIPVKCLQEVQGEYSVFVVDAENKVEFRAVELGETLQDMVIVTSGLNANERIVLEGLSRVRTGMTVQPQDKAFESVRNNQQ
ncbi:efflux RND transporter periplasmic adaptor subunit [Carboxylicivirga mesophila]|uniref:Efflux RND transporter periplasmic adaptor subunit n=1 Tax=Carboxylicivirga mesophila TaxID=1166478 RepID=A0ABS5KG32_9BACT|nr:efflux RND transporter periplasmic adaptor subunit [Carboxylicivirga mesophila]MBS2213772.1 efflux RND transporter periplasmic adaptor subunit [Carboxylicivirga mesophila]